jgi:asparagine synthase (glutamine-hydrolysing)
MCGIVGVFDPNGLANAETVEAQLSDAAATMAYRGPDAAGVVVQAKDGVGFAHRRLSILDLDPRANQPMKDRDNLVTYNGEIYNFQELRSTLLDAGETFKTQSDTEVLLVGYRAWGLAGLLDRIVGMFAFALYDSQQRCLILARDRAGKKPLFYHARNGRITFASEMRALLHLAPEAKEMSSTGLDAYLQLKFTPSPQTLFAGVQKLAPGHTVTFGPQGSGKPLAYWHPYLHGRVFQGHESAWLDAIEKSLTQAVQRRLVSDVPVCLFLSGGIDSSLLAERLSSDGRRLKTYTIGYGDKPEYDEFEYARSIAKKFSLDYEEVVFPIKDAEALLRDDALVLDEPISDWVWAPLSELSRRASSDGYKVVLLGEGADEIFFGYDVMMQGVQTLDRYRSAAWRGLATLGAKALAPVYRHASRGHRRYDRWRRVASQEPAYLGSSVGFPASQRSHVAGERLLAAGAPNAGALAVGEIYDRFNLHAPDPEDLYNQVCWVEFHTKMTEVLLQRVDRVTMQHSLEARAPFLDHQLVELAFSIPGPLKTKGHKLKGLLKEWARTRLPNEIVDRPKMGFSFPFKEWLRGDLGNYVEDIFQSSALFRDGWVRRGFAQGLLRQHQAGIDHAPRIWQLFSLARWYDKWMVSSP